MKESELQTQICEWLTYQKIFFWRQNNITVSQDGEYRRKGKYFKYGIPDIAGIYKGKVFFIEVKSDTGELSAAQKEFFEECQKEVIPICLAKGQNGLDTVVEMLRKLES